MSGVKPDLRRVHTAAASSLRHIGIFVTAITCAWLMTVAVFAESPVVTASVARWSAEMKAFAAQDAAAPSPDGAVLFIGSSSIRFWKTLAEDFPGLHPINRGFGGSEIVDSVVHFDSLVLPHHPSWIVFYAGTNDLTAGKSPEEVAADFRTFCQKLHHARPTTRILYLSIQMAPSRWYLRDKMALANTYIAAFCHADPRRLFLDTNATMLTSDGLPRSEFYSNDRLHMAPAGYAEWTRLVAPILRGETKIPVTPVSP